MTSRFDALPQALQTQSTTTLLAGGRVPALLVAAEGSAEGPAPTLLWMHGRTAWKELDPGRYLRLMRSGVNVCAIDLPGHGERENATLQGYDAIASVVDQAIDEIDPVVSDLVNRGFADSSRLALGGMSAGGMVTLGRLCMDHPFIAGAVESTTGDWGHRHQRGFFGEHDQVAATRSPIDHLDGFRQIPLLALHSEADQRVEWAPQRRFLRLLADRYAEPGQVVVATWTSTDAPMEHDGFGRESAEAKELQRTFLEATLTGEISPDGAALHRLVERACTRARLLW